MTRRQIFTAAGTAFAALLGLRWLRARDGTQIPVSSGSARADAGSAVDRLELPKEKWKELIADPNAYRVMFEEATERPFTSPLNDEKRPGTFVCAACFLPLFRSETKYNSGTGWPSFYDTIAGRVGTKTDYKIVIPRTEYHCARCDSHQGHVFNDGPQPTGKRYCNNGVALQFAPDGEALPELRKV